MSEVCDCVWRCAETCKECRRENEDGIIRDQRSVELDGNSEYPVLSWNNTMDAQHIEEVTA